MAPSTGATVALSLGPGNTTASSTSDYFYCIYFLACLEGAFVGSCRQRPVIDSARIGAPIVNEAALTALGPLDGRYEKTVSELRDYFSEYALIKYRVKVELEWLKFLMKRQMIRQ
jgi:hypothetical protein